MGLIHDSTYCIGCRACQQACQDGYDLMDALRMEIREHETVRNGALSVVYRMHVCRQCGEPHCAKACPTGALVRREGAVLLEQARCIGCGKCGTACPVGAISFTRVGRGRKAVKCTLCAERGGVPLCVAACPMQCIAWRDEKGGERDGAGGSAGALFTGHTAGDRHRQTSP